MVLADVANVLSLAQYIYNKRETIDENNVELLELIDRTESLREDIDCMDQNIIPERLVNSYKILLEKIKNFVRKHKNSFIMRLVFSQGNEKQIERFNRKLDSLNSDLNRATSGHVKREKSSSPPRALITKTVPNEVPEPPVNTSNKWSFFGRKKKVEKVNSPPSAAQSRKDATESISPLIQKPVVSTQRDLEISHKPLVLSEKEKEAEKLALLDTEDDDIYEDDACLEPTERCIEITEGVGMCCVVLTQLTMVCATVC